MNASKILAVAALATVASFGAHADEGPGASYQPLQIESTRTRAEVQAEAAQAARHEDVTLREGYAGVAPSTGSTLDRATVRAQAIEALRLGQIQYGDVSSYL